MVLKLATRLAPKTVFSGDTPVVLAGNMVGEDGVEALSVAGAVAALTALSVVEIESLDHSALKAVIPTADGTTTAIIPDGGRLTVCTVASANAAHWVVLPAPVPGTIVVLLGNATIYEMRSSAPATVGIGGNTPTAGHESAIPASAVCIMICLNATAWVGWTILGATLAAVEAAAT